MVGEGGRQVNGAALAAGGFLLCPRLAVPPAPHFEFPYMCGSLSGPSILFHWSVCLSLCHYHTKYYGFIIILATQKGRSPCLILLIYSCLSHS